MAKYFKKPNGVIIEVTPGHDLASLEHRFEECDVSGKEIKKTVKQEPKKARK